MLFLKPATVRHLALALVLLLAGLSLAPATAFATADKDPLTTYFFTDRRVYQAGEPVNMYALLINTSDKPVEIWFETGQFYCFRARRPDTERFWCWSWDRRFIMALQRRVLEPGEFLFAHEVWDQTDADGRPVEAGTYTLGGVFRGAWEGRNHNWVEREITIVE